MEPRFALIPPEGGSFDRDALLARAEADPAVFVHPAAEPLTLVVTSHEATARRLAAALRSDPTAPTGDAGFIVIGPWAITAYLEYADRSVLAKVRALLEPIILAHGPRIVNAEFGNDVTDRYRGNVAALFA